MGMMNMDLNSLGTFDVNHLTGVGHLSEKMKQLFGMAPDAELGLDVVVHAIHPKDCRATIAAYANSLLPNGPEHFALQYRVRLPDGCVRWLFLVARTLRSEAPHRRPLSTIGFAMDITREKELEHLDELTCA
jgi:PAS domain S-box-containing protein